MKGIFLHTIMKNDDQWFEPGDKVMRVSQKRPNGVYFSITGSQATDITPYGKVFCVEFCEHDEGVNWIHLSGFRPLRVLAANFRKVEEIQLCVRAAEAMKKPKKQEEMA